MNKSPPAEIKTFLSYIKRLGEQWVGEETLDTARQKWEVFLSSCLTFGRFRIAMYGQFIIPTRYRR